GWAYLSGDAPKWAQRDFQAVIRLRRDSGEGYAGRGYLRARDGFPDDAVADAREAERRAAGDPRVLSYAARTYALAAADGQAAAQRPAWQKESVRLLGKAMEAVPAAQRRLFWQRFIADDRDLAALQDRADYQQLKAEYLNPTK